MSLEDYLSFFPIVLMLVALLPSYAKSDRKTAKLENYLLLLTSYVLICLVLLLRDINAAVDINSYFTYYSIYSDFQNVLDSFKFNTAARGSTFFAILLYIGNLLSLEKEAFFHLYPIICLTFYLVGLIFIFKSIKHQLLALSFFAVTSTFPLLFVNALRQGLALSLLLLSIGLTSNKKTFMGMIFLLLSCLSHTSMFLIGASIILSNIIIERRIYERKIPTKSIKKFFRSFLFIAIPLIPIVLSGYANFLLNTFSLSRGYLSENYDYDNYYIVSARLVILIIFSIVFYRYGKKLLLFNNQAYNYIFRVYLLIVLNVILFLPALLVASRLIYYASGLMPVLFSFLFYQKPHFIKFRDRILLFFASSVCYGYFVYNFQSVRFNLVL